MNILALDLSLTCTGYAFGDSHGLHTISTYVPPKGFDRGIDRLRWIRRCVLTDSRIWNPDLVVLESYAFGRANQAHYLGELGGVVRVGLADSGMTFVDVPPSSLKLFATGKGNAKKEVMLGEAIRKLGYQGNSTDESDALWLLTMAQAHYEGSASNEAQRKALSKIVWPKIHAEAAA